MRPGTWLLKIAPFIFNERFIDIVVRPTIADLQSEVAAAGSNHAKRFRVRWRGYAAFWTLMFMAPFASWSEERANVASGLAAGSFVVTLLTVVTLGPWTALVAAGATLVALLLHGWYARHPSEIAVPPDPWRTPQINFSSTDIAGNIGGLIFVVGSVLIVSLALPSIFWFLLTGGIAACFVAWGLAAWHTRARRADWTCAGRPRRLLL